ncbi:MAG: AhpC/TSA family protein [Deltaproteobacteria bacterium]|nr:AhpC/TSA family protein [Deltaproteobacteria bacterium]
MFCREQVAQLRGAQAEIEARGVRLVVIGNGTPDYARAFREEAGIDFELWVDPEMKAYAAAGLKAGGAWGAFSLRSPGHTLRALKAGFRQTAVKGDPWQLGGVFLITAAGKTVYQQRSREAGDHAPLDEVMAAIEGLAGR